MRRLTFWLAGGGLLLLLAAGAALAGGSLRDETPDSWLLRPADDGGEHVLLGPVSVTEPAISPEPQFPSSRGIKDQTILRFSLLTPDTVLVGIYIWGTDEVLKPIQSFVPIRGIGEYTLPFEGVLFYASDRDTLPDDFFRITVRAVSLVANRVEADTTELEIDRRLPEIGSLAVTNATGGFRNDETITIEAGLDRPGNTVLPDFSKVSSDTAGRTTVADLGDGRYTIRHQISAANLRGDGADLEIPVTFVDRAGNGFRDANSLKICLSNHPPLLASIGTTNHAGASYRNGDRLEIESVWDCPDTLLTVTADFRSLDSHYDPANVTTTRKPGNRYVSSYPISDDNQLGDGDYLIAVTAVDRGCGVSATATIALTLDNNAGEAPVIDPLPSTSRASDIVISGLAPGSVRVDIKRSGAIIDTARVNAAGRFRKTIHLVTGSNSLTVDGYDGADNKSPVSLAVSVYFISAPAITVPAPFRAGNSILITTPRTAERVRVRLWTLGGDLVAVLEDRASRDLYLLTWNGQAESGQRINAGPLLSTIEIHYPDGQVDEERRALLLAAP